MKTSRTWLTDKGLSSILYRSGSSHGWRPEFEVFDGQDTILLWGDSARNLAEFIIKTLEEESPDANL